MIFQFRIQNKKEKKIGQRINAKVGAGAPGAFKGYRHLAKRPVFYSAVAIFLLFKQNKSQFLFWRTKMSFELWLNSSYPISLDVAKRKESKPLTFLMDVDVVAVFVVLCSRDRHSAGACQPKVKLLQTRKLIWWKIQLFYFVIFVPK